MIVEDPIEVGLLVSGKEPTGRNYSRQPFNPECRFECREDTWGQVNGCFVIYPDGREKTSTFETVNATPGVAITVRNTFAVV